MALTKTRKLAAKAKTRKTAVRRPISVVRRVAKSPVGAEEQVKAAAVVDELLPDEEHPAIQQLVERGKQKRFVTYDDILHFFPEAERDIDQLDEAHAALLAAGIEGVDTVDADDPTEDDMEETEAEIESDNSRDLGDDETYLSA